VDEESRRLEDARTGGVAWRKWGPYLSERQWGTVREDYSASGDAWSYFSHDQARSRAYHWGEDGLAGFSDDRQLLCVALALWNGVDPILKERLFGLTNAEGNHGEDVKEYYFYLDSTPTHSYMKYLYKYPQAQFPYRDVVETNHARGRNAFEYELVETGVFDGDRYFDVFVEYAKATPEDVLIRITAHNRGPEPATIHLLPTIWFRRVTGQPEGGPRPTLSDNASSPPSIAAFHPSLGDYVLWAEGATDLLFTDNETNAMRVFGMPNDSAYVKDGINDFVVNGQRDRVNPNRRGTKAAARYVLTIPPGQAASIRLRLSDLASAAGHAEGPFGAAFDAVMETRQREADAFYSLVIPPSMSADETNVMRQALAGMLWTKQFYYYDVNQWLEEHGADPFKPKTTPPRNDRWHHMYNQNVLSMPDKWEYPWYAAWDLAFHVIPLNMVDPDFGKQQLDLILSERYLHPSGQLPAYEWNFGDVNPPVHAWSTIFTYRLDMMRRGQGDIDWLERVFHKLLLNFTWWVNRKDRSGDNAFEGGFLGLDNIGVFDRSAPLPTGGFLEQADGTAWMALYCQNMIEIAVELAMQRPAYTEISMKFVEHFMWIASALFHAGGGTGMWDEEDGFFYDVLRLPDGRSQRLKVRSMVGLLPLCAVTVYEGKLAKRAPEILTRMRLFIENRMDPGAAIHDPLKTGYAGRRLGAILDETKLRRVLARMLDEREFLSPYGIRSLSRYHASHPYVLRFGKQEYGVSYVPAESDSGMFGGNSNWRGPIWMPVNALIVRALYQYYAYYGNDFTIECPTGSGRMMTLYQVAEEITRRLSSIFLKDKNGRRPVYGGTTVFQENPHWRDLVLFYEYFHGDNGAGLGASHQTGWTGVIATLMRLFAERTAEQALETPKYMAPRPEPAHATSAR